MELMVSPQSTTQNEDLDSCARKLQKIRCEMFHRKKLFWLILQICLQYFFQDCIYINKVGSRVICAF